MIYFIDIDETICNTPDSRDYSEAEPIYDNIRKFNCYYDEGHHVVYWTARGTGSGIDWRSVTERQFKDWGVKYHELKFGKPIYDILIDDKAENPRDL
jgi:histidinol phosphatase-like enzyme